MTVARVVTTITLLACVTAVVPARRAASQAASPATAAQLADEGVRLISSSRLVDAQGVFERARDLAQQQGDAVVEGRALWGLGRLAFLRRDRQAAEAQYARAAELLAAAQARDLVTVLLLQRGGELFESADYAGAELRWRTGLDAIGHEEPRWLRGQLLRSLSFLPTIAVGTRLAMIEEAGRLVEGQGRPALEGLVAHQHGDLAFSAGDFARALRETERAVSLLERAGARNDLARALTSIGRIYRVHGQPEQAVPYFTRALEVQRGAGDRGAAVQSLIGIAIAELTSGRHASAAEAYARAVETARVTGVPVDLGAALVQQAYGFVEMGRVGDAERCLAEVRSLPGDPRTDAQARAVQGMVHFAAGRHLEAVEAFDGALAAGPSLAPDNRVEILDRRARALDALGRSEAAIDAAQKAIDALERLRASLVPRDFFKRRFDEAWARMLRISVRRLAEAGEAGPSLVVAEGARARAFADLLAGRALQRAPLLSSAPGEEAAGAMPSPLVMRGTSPSVSGQGVSLESASRVESSTLDEMIATAKAADTTLLAYWVDQDVTFAWVIPPSGEVSLRRLPIGAAALERAVRATFTPKAAAATRPSGGARVRGAEVAGPGEAVLARGPGAFTLGPESRVAYRTLYAALVEPLRPLLPAAGAPLTIVPHGPLFRLSFAALHGRAGRYLVEDYRLSYAPSATILRLVHHARAPSGADSVVLVGDPAVSRVLATAEGLERLPGAAREVEAIRRRVAPRPVTVLREGAASEAAVRGAAAAARVVHFATHAIVDDARPFESYLALAGDPTRPDEDGRLTADEVYGLALDADLVVLSACRSAGGPVTGDGLLGLTRAFFAAGAHSVVATLWDLPDEAATVLLPRFYVEWQATGSKAEALRRAQLAYLADLRAGRVVVTSPLGTTTLPEHPSLWASLVLQGRP